MSKHTGKYKRVSVCVGLNTDYSLQLSSFARLNLVCAYQWMTWMVFCVEVKTSDSRFREQRRRETLSLSLDVTWAFGEWVSYNGWTETQILGLRPRGVLFSYEDRFDSKSENTQLSIHKQSFIFPVYVTFHQISKVKIIYKMRICQYASNMWTVHRDLKIKCAVSLHVLMHILVAFLL